jgi:hypothetical protein
LAKARACNTSKELEVEKGGLRSALFAFYKLFLALLQFGGSVGCIGLIGLRHDPNYLVRQLEPLLPGLIKPLAHRWLPITSAGRFAPVGVLGIRVFVFCEHGNHRTCEGGHHSGPNTNPKSYDVAVHGGLLSPAKPTLFRSGKSDNPCRLQLEVKL